MKCIISIDVTTLTWTEGNHAWFDFVLEQDEPIEVHWGDGHISRATGKHMTIKRVAHYYKKLDTEESYRIEFFVEHPGALIALFDGTWEMTVNRIVFMDCPHLKDLAYHQLNEVDFSGCPNIEYLDITGDNRQEIDLSYFPKLRKIICDQIRAKTLNLTGNPDIETISVCGCRKLRKLALANYSHLKTISYNLTDLDGNSIKWIKSIVERNDGEIVEDVFPDYISAGCYGGEI